MIWGAETFSGPLEPWQKLIWDTLRRSFWNLASGTGLGQHSQWHGPYLQRVHMPIPWGDDFCCFCKFLMHAIGFVLKPSLFLSLSTHQLSQRNNDDYGQNETETLGHFNQSWGPQEHLSQQHRQQGHRTGGHRSHLSMISCKRPIIGKPSCTRSWKRLLTPNLGCRLTFAFLGNIGAFWCLFSFQRDFQLLKKSFWCKSERVFWV